jgi:hypothetical protein
MTKPMRNVVGELRPSQTIFTYGIGAIVDLPFVSTMMMGLDEWAEGHCTEIIEGRLLNEVRRRLGEKVKKLVGPPVPAEEEQTWVPLDPNQRIGIPVAVFPRWVRCPNCKLLAPLSSGLFTLKVDPYHPEKTKYVHENCHQAKRPPTVLPARFMVTCTRGHLDDFPWSHFVHRGNPCDHPHLEMYDVGVEGETSNLEVHCKSCGGRRRLIEAFQQVEKEDLFPACQGRRVHLRDYDDEICSEPVTPIALGASNCWFSASLSLLSLPVKGDKLNQLVMEKWQVLKDVEEVEVLKFLCKRNEIPTLKEFEDQAILSAIESARSGESDLGADGDLWTPEWELFSSPQTAPSSKDFKIREVEVSKDLVPYFESVILADRLREVQALIGFTRLGSWLDISEPGKAGEIQMGKLSRTDPRFVPAAEVRGEGIFIRFREERVADWCSKNQNLASLFHEAHTKWRQRRHIEPPEAGFPGLRYILLHSFAHALMRQLALECGYTAASIRERIYAREQGDDEKKPPMAGVLFYTAAPDSEGTLGGLVRLGLPDQLRRHVIQALEAMTLCSSDPMCAEHQPGIEGDSLHGAACHACLFSPETSCERGNKYLDRNVLVKTMALQVEEPYFAILV